MQLNFQFYIVKWKQKKHSCKKVIVFGDSAYDIPMFHMADEAYATKNAIEELKEIATGIIKDNNTDAVAKWLTAHI